MSPPDTWRYVTPCCKTTCWNFRPTLGVYYCKDCRSRTTKLLDKKTDRRVMGVGKR